MIRIAITAEAFEAIAATLPLGSVGVEREHDANGPRFVWLDAAVVDRLKAMRGPGECVGSGGSLAKVEGK